MMWLFYCFIKDFGNISNFDSVHEVYILIHIYLIKHLIHLDFLKVVVNDIIDLC